MQEGKQGAQTHGGAGPIGYTNVQFPGPLVKKGQAREDGQDGGRQNSLS